LLAVALALSFGLVTAARTDPAGARADRPLPEGDLVRPRDRIAIIGSSSTRFGTWPRTLEFLLRTRHPELELEFQSYSTGGGTFQTGLDHLDTWLDEFRPTLVFFNYGVNDSGAGEFGLEHFKDRMEKCVHKAQAHGARVILVTPQAADVRRSGPPAAARRSTYAETMLAFGRRHGWTVIDVHHPLKAMQLANEATDPSYTILADSIHLTRSAYVGMGFLVYDRLNLPFVRTAATLAADGTVSFTENCGIRDVVSKDGDLSFLRLDRVLPILPPGLLPPRLSIPLEDQSRYMLKITGLEPGNYEIRCEGIAIGTVTSQTLSVGVNLNTVLLDSRKEPPWSVLAGLFWQRQGLNRIGHTQWRFVVHKL
jgi:lysophospholipase L1-like esterase